MPWTDIMDQLAQEAILLDPGNLSGCGKMLKLLEQLDYPEIDQLKDQLKGYLEAMIMNELDGNCPELDAIIDVTEQIKKALQSSGEETSGEAPSTVADTNGKKESAAEKKPAQKKKAAKKPASKESAEKSPAEAEKPTAASSEFVVEDAELLNDFIVEANDHLESIEINSVEW